MKLSKNIIDRDAAIECSKNKVELVSGGYTFQKYSRIECLQKLQLKFDAIEYLVVHFGKRYMAENLAKLP